MHPKYYQDCIKPIFWGLVLSGGLIFFIQQIIYNPTISLRRGYYFTYPLLTPKLHDIVLLCVWDSKHIKVMHKLGLPKTDDACGNHTPYLMKEIVAVEGDIIEVTTSGVRVNDYLYPNSQLLSTYHQINLLPINFGVFRLGTNEYFVLGVTPRSYDSRYFGVIVRQQIYRGASLIFASDKLLW
jgi:signal peptidase I